MSFTFRLADGDIEDGQGGSQLQIVGAEKAAQDLLYECLTPYDPVLDRGNELFQPNGQLTLVVGQSAFAASAVAAYFRSAITRLMRAQARDANTSASEVIQQIKTVNVTSVRGDPTAINFFIAVVVEGRDIVVARDLSLSQLSPH